MGEVRETELAGFPAIESGRGTGRPPLLLLHGAFCTHACFRAWVRLFAQRGWHAVSASRRGRLGVPPPQAAGVDMAQYLDDARRQVDALGGAPALIGFSAGGLIAQKLAEENRCTAAVLLASPPPWRITPSLHSIPSLLPHLADILLGRPIRPSFHTAVRSLLNRVPQADRSRIFSALVPESGIAFRQIMQGAVRVDAGRVRCPLRVIAADEDRVATPEMTRRVADHYGASWRLFEGHGHWLIEEPGWESIATDAAEWLEDVVARAPAAAAP